MKTRLGRMEAFDALLEARFEAFFSDPETPSVHLDDETEKDAPEPDRTDSPPAMPPPVAGHHEPPRRAAHLA